MIPSRAMRVKQRRQHIVTNTFFSQYFGFSSVVRNDYTVTSQIDQEKQNKSVDKSLFELKSFSEHELAALPYRKLQQVAFNYGFPSTEPGKILINRILNATSVPPQIRKETKEIPIITDNIGSNTIVVDLKDPEQWKLVTKTNLLDIMRPERPSTFMKMNKPEIIQKYLATHTDSIVQICLRNARVESKKLTPAPKAVVLLSPRVNAFQKFLRIATESNQNFKYTASTFESILQKYRQGQNLPREHVLKLVNDAISRLEKTRNVIRIQQKTDCCLNICGDIHGHYRDLIRIFDADVGGLPSDTNQYVFMGNLVDFGTRGVEVMVVLLFLQQMDPSSVYLLRGNHEVSAMNEQHGFASEVLLKYDSEVLRKFRELFAALQIAAVVDESFLICHGGLGRHTSQMRLSDIDKIHRVGEPAHQGALSEMLWSNPHDNRNGLTDNSGGGFIFGPDITASFLKRNGLKLLIRSNEMVPNGCQMSQNNNCLTIFSASNFCDLQQNKGALLRFQGSQSKARVVQFESSNSFT